MKYDDINGFENELAQVKINDKYGFIDKTGKQVIPIQFDEAQERDKKCTISFL